MPQVFQVIRCSKCFIFQVQQLKKSNKWECKVCGEKQSIKRHYGLGTAKDCRLHVQKLNSARGEIIKTQMESNADECENSSNIINSQRNALTLSRVNLSKWSSYIDRSEDNTKESQDSCSGYDVLKSPKKSSKRRNRHEKAKYKESHEAAVVKENFPLVNSENHSSVLNCDKSKTQVSNSDNRCILSDIVLLEKDQDVNNTNNVTQPGVVSKWKRFLDEDKDHNSLEKKSICVTNSVEANLIKDSACDEVCQQENLDNNGIILKDNANINISNNFKRKCIFSTCDDLDIDDVLKL